MIQENLQARLRLADLLRENQLTPYRLAREVRGLTPTLVYAYAAGRKKPGLEALAKLAAALSRLVGRPVEPNDLIEFMPVTPAPEGERLEMIKPDAGGRLGLGAKRVSLPAGAQASEEVIAQLRAERDMAP